MSYFPMFIQLKGESCLVVGGGAVALHKVEVLQDFGAAVLVTALGRVLLVFFRKQMAAAC